jgi:hypothetical protein
MKSLILSSIITLLAACTSTQTTFTTAPWECISTTEPRDAVVVRKEGRHYIFDCGWNGGEDGGDGDDGGEGAE